MSRILSKDGQTVVTAVIFAETTPARMKGLLGRRGLDPAVGMLIRPCRSIHMWFMRFPIDAAFLDSEYRVLKVARNLKPWQLAFAPRKTVSVLETAAGGLNGIKPGASLHIE